MFEYTTNFKSCIQKQRDSGNLKKGKIRLTLNWWKLHLDEASFKRTRAELQYFGDVDKSGKACGEGIGTFFKYPE